MEKLMIAIPAGDTLPTLFCKSLHGLAKPDDTKTVFAVGTLVHDARNKLAEAALANDAEYVLWLDSDMVFEPDLLLRLEAALNESGADMVSAVYWRRRPPYEPVVYSRFEPDEENNGWIMETLKDVPDGICDIEACGFGGVLMKASVLQLVMKMWPRPFDMMDGTGEDLAFCLRARMMGAKMVCDGRIKMGHAGLHVFGDWKS